MKTSTDVIFIGSQDNGRLKVRDGASLSRYLRTLGDKVLEINIKPFRQRRTQRQNNWYFACVEMIAKAAGITKEQMHEEIKRMFVYEVVTMKTRRGNYDIFVPASTADYNTKEFTDFMEERLRPWVKEFWDMDLPDPKLFGLVEEDEKTNKENGNEGRTEEGEGVGGADSVQQVQSAQDIREGGVEGAPREH